MTVDALKVARFMFERNALAFGAEPHLIDEMWNADAGIRDFWTKEAEAVLGFVGFAQ